MDHAVAEDYVKGLLSGGEVVLIDTRQHWMAAVRYAVKPILIAILGGLMLALSVALNLGDLLDWVISTAMWILIIIAVVWLPIDLVRWYSRKYVLTNRRAMRMSGVMRKKSFDSSLEQINDIGLVQSVLGRALNYADLTLYTASDTANESYEQLKDGIQFKKAVLDAKEAIRLDAPLTALPAGFIVKGGTNEASMRADGKLEEAATADDATQPLAPATADTTSQEPATAAAPAAAAAVQPDENAPGAAAAAVLEPKAAPAAEPVAAPAPEVAPEPPPAAPSIPDASVDPDPVVQDTAQEPAPPTAETPAAESPAAEVAWPEADTAKSGNDAAETPTTDGTDDKADGSSGSSGPA
jgi:hypothetical protein